MLHFQKVEPQTEVILGVQTKQEESVINGKKTN
jgi:hypothetical protein